ncbi:hypothetical protein JCM14202_2206 [Agrilactobacillus composti DSM 18527 = JCM 14202]|nr:hypothetical protein [Agrilactobacillus composti]GAF40312.1 hypothetical protein JCM14202_2206 [Agrilactobacillus composti DSM 18527 = JCM 14202]
MRDVRDNFVWQQRFEPVRRRFGFLGLFLYKRYSKKAKWQRTGYVRKLYSGWFYLIYGMPLSAGELYYFYLSGKFVALSFWGLLSYVVFGYIYGRWAEDYFEKFKQR